MTHTHAYTHTHTYTHAYTHYDTYGSVVVISSEQFVTDLSLK